MANKECFAWQPCTTMFRVYTWCVPSILCFWNSGYYYLRDSKYTHIHRHLQLSSQRQTEIRWWIFGKEKNKYKILSDTSQFGLRACTQAGRQLDRHGSFISREKDAQTKQGYPNSLLFFAHSFVLLFPFFQFRENHTRTESFDTTGSAQFNSSIYNWQQQSDKKRLREKKKSGSVETHCSSFECDQRHKMSLLPGHFFTCDCFPLFPLSTIFQTFSLYMWRYTFPSYHFFLFTPKSSLFEVAPLKNPCQCILLWSLKRWCVPCCGRNRIFCILLNLNLTALTF